MIPPDSPAEIVDTMDQVMRQALEAVITISACSAKDRRYSRQIDFSSMEHWAEIYRDVRKAGVCNIQYLNFFLLHFHFFDVCSNSTYLLAG